MDGKNYVNGKQEKSLRWLDERQKRGNAVKMKGNKSLHALDAKNIISCGDAGQCPWRVA
jgi:hypothetical protein